MYCQLTGGLDDSPQELKISEYKNESDMNMDTIVLIFLLELLYFMTTFFRGSPCNRSGLNIILIKRNAAPNNEKYSGILFAN